MISLYLKNISTFDIQTINFVANFRNPTLNQLMIFITNLASTKTIIAATIISLLILFFLKKWSYIQCLLISVLGGQIIVFFIKNLICRSRPFPNNALVFENDFSFPSGHSFSAIAFYGIIIFFIINHLQKKIYKHLVVLLGILLIITIGISRIYLGAHWPSDILASFFLGSLWLFTVIKIHQKIK
jgi:undecaprenyl-diphosphatase